MIDAIIRQAEIFKVQEICARRQLRVLREHSCLSVRGLARAVSVAPSTVSRWETGERMPTGDRAVALLHAAERMAGVTGTDGDFLVGAKKARAKLARKDAEFRALDGALFKAWMESDRRRGLEAETRAGETQRIAKAAQARLDAQARSQMLADDDARRHAERILKSSTSMAARQAAQAGLDALDEKASREFR